MAIELNLQGDCSDSLLGTGLASCVALYGDLTGIDLYTKGSFALDTTSGTFPDEAAYQLLVQGKSVFPLNDIFQFEQNTPDNELATSSRGIVKEIRTGKPQFSLTWSNGACFHAGLDDKRGNNLWDIAMKFETGVLYATNIAKSVLKPFTAGMFSPATYKVQQATDPDMSTAVFQYPSADEFNSRQVFFTWDEIGYDQTDTNGVLDATVAYTIAPSASTDFSASVKSKCNSSVVITGLDDINDWKLNGTQASATTISTVTFNTVTQAYDFVVSPILVSADTIELSLADVAATLDVAKNASGDFYQGQAPLATVA